MMTMMTMMSERRSAIVTSTFRYQRPPRKRKGGHARGAGDRHGTEAAGKRRRARHDAGGAPAARRCFQDGRQRCARVILRNRPDCAGFQTAQRLHQQAGAQLGQSRRQGQRRIFRKDLHFSLQQNVTGIEAFVQQHGAYAGDALAVRNGPLNRRRAAILGQQRSMNIDVPARGQREHPGRNDASVPHDDDGFRRQIGKLLLKLFVLPDFFRLDDRQVQLLRRLLHRRSSQFHATPLGPVRLGHHQLHVKSGRRQPLQRRNSELRSPAEDQLHFHSPCGGKDRQDQR